MTTTQKPTAIARQWIHVLRHGSPKLLAASLRIEADKERIQQLKQSVAEEYRRDPVSAAKYADLPYWMPFNLERVGELGLERRAPLRLLDIGCGPGYFLACARACGHDVYGVDIPASMMTPTERKVYSELLPALGLDGRVSPLLVERFKPLQLPQRNLDLITAFWICFNRHRQPDEWGVEEWRFFIDDALGYLKPDGMIYLQLNEHPERYGALRWYDSATAELFRSAGSLNGNIVQIRKNQS